MEQWNKVTWSDKSHFGYQVNGRGHMHCLPGEEMAAECTMGRRHACWKTLIAAIHVDVNLTCHALKSVQERFKDMLPWPPNYPVSMGCAGPTNPIHGDSSS